MGLDLVHVGTFGGQKAEESTGPSCPSRKGESRPDNMVTFHKSATWPDECQAFQHFLQYLFRGVGRHLFLHGPIWNFEWEE